jgi:hypothetical protein
MDQENQPSLQDLSPSENAAATKTTHGLPTAESLAPESSGLTTGARMMRALRWVFMGSGGLRAGWSVLVFALVAVCSVVIRGCRGKQHPHYVSRARW